jgi:protein-tyrosine phosphatase
VRALVGRSADHDAAAALAARGIDCSEHRARQLTATLLRSADLVLTFEGWQRVAAVQEDPGRHRSVLTIRRAGEVLGAAGGRADGLDLLCADRHRYGPEDDFADPVGMGIDAVAAAVAEIEDLLRVILPGLGAIPGAAETQPDRGANATE